MPHGDAATHHGECYKSPVTQQPTSGSGFSLLFHNPNLCPPVYVAYEALSHQTHVSSSIQKWNFGAAFFFGLIFREKGPMTSNQPTNMSSNSLCPQDVPPAIGLTTGGQLYWGAALVATEVTSAQIRSGGAGGPALLYTTRKSLMYTVFFSQLSAGHVHKELLQRDQDAEGQVIRRGM